MKKFLLPLSLISMGLTGCQTTGGIGMVGSPMWDLTTSDEQKWAYYESTCEKYGFTKGTNAFSQCLMQTKMSVENDTKDGWGNFRDASSRMGTMYNDDTINCTSTSIGRTVNTTCN